MNQIAVKENRPWWWGLCSQQDTFQVWRVFLPNVAMLINRLSIDLSPKIIRGVGNPVYYVKLSDCEE